MVHKHHNYTKNTPQLSSCFFPNLLQARQQQHSGRKGGTLFFFYFLSLTTITAWSERRRRRRRRRINKERDSALNTSAGFKVFPTAWGCRNPTCSQVLPCWIWFQIQEPPVRLYLCTLQPCRMLVFTPFVHRLIVL